MDKLYSRKGITMANGVAEAIPHSPFRAKVVNLSKVPRFLPKGMLLGYVLPHPIQVEALVDCSSEDSRAATWSSSEADSTKVDEVPDPDQGRANLESWKDQIGLGHLVQPLRGKAWKMLFRHRGVWYGCLGEIQATQHRIDLSPESQPIHCQPYLTGPRARAAKEADVSRMLDQGVI